MRAPLFVGLAACAAPWASSLGHAQTVTNPPPSTAAYAPLASPAFTGAPTAPTPTTGDSSTKLATTVFLGTAISNAIAPLAPLASPNFTGTVSAPNLLVGGGSVQSGYMFTNNGSSYIGANEFVSGGITTGAITDYGAAQLGSLSLTGSVAQASVLAGPAGAAGAPTQRVLGYADITGAAPLASPNFTGTPQVPTATAGTSTTQAASTSFVSGAIITATSTLAPINNPTFTGTVTTPALAVTGSQTAKTVLAAPNAANGAPSWRALIASDIPTLAPLLSPAFTGTPTAPTAAVGTNTTQVATMAAIASAVSALITPSTGFALAATTAPTAGTAPTGATQITAAITVVTTCPTGALGQLAPATGVQTQVVYNACGASFNIYPAAAGKIGAMTANLPIRVDGAMVAKFDPLGSGNVYPTVGANYSWNDPSLVISIPALTASSCQLVSVTEAKARVGDRVIITDTSGALLNNNVATSGVFGTGTAGQLQVKLCNVSGITGTAASSPTLTAMGWGPI